ncbi:Protein AH9.1, partial [Aphelenchoides avenae]
MKQILKSKNSMGLMSMSCVVSPRREVSCYASGLHGPQPHALDASQLPAAAAALVGVVEDTAVAASAFGHSQFGVFVNDPARSLRPPSAARLPALGPYPLPGAYPSTELFMSSSDEDWRVDYVAHVYVMPCLLIIGFVNQCLNVWTLNSLAPVGYLYLKASAIADILSIIALVPFCVRHGNAHNPYSYPGMFFHTHVELPLINSLITASALCLVAMTVDRYLSIRHPIAFFNSPDSRTRIRTTIGCLFCLAFVVFIPSGWQKVLIQEVDTLDNNRTYYRIERNHHLNQSDHFKVYLAFRELVARIGPIVILVVLNVGMIRSLRRISARYNTRRRSMTPAVAASVALRTPNRAREQDRTRISVLLLITSATFVVCTLPASLISLLIDQTRNSFGMQVFRAFANCLQVSHYLHNFYLYALCSCEYRQAFLTLTGCTKQRTSSLTGDSPTIRLSTTVLDRVRSL